MIMNMEKNINNFKTVFLQLLCLILNIEYNKIRDIIYADENLKENKSKELPSKFPKNSKEQSIQINELEIAIKIVKNNPSNILGDLSENSYKLLKKIINEFNYNVKKMLYELNEHLKSKKLTSKISIFDLFCFSLLSIENEPFLKEIQSNFIYIFKWLQFIINLEPISDACEKIQICQNFRNNVKSSVSDINEKKSKYYFKYIKNNGLGKFIEFNGRKINNNSKNKLIDGNIYYFFSFENSDNLIITEETEIHDYIIEKNSFNKNIPFSFFGKLMDIVGNTYVIISDDLEQIIFLNDIEKIIQNSEINEYKKYLAMKLIKYNDDSIFLETNKVSKIESPILQEYSYMINTINNKVLIKCNFLDYKRNENYYNYISLNTYKNIMKIEINNETIYYVYQENEISNEYFPQNIQLIRGTSITNFKILLYKGFCNEINVFLNIVGGFAYEYYFICSDKKIVPKPVEIKLDNGIFSSNNFWKFDTTKRYKITFVNTPNQDTNINKSGFNSFLKIFTYTDSEKINNYGTFLLNDLEIKKPIKIQINYSFKEFINQIDKDVYLFLDKKIEANVLKSKYLEHDKVEEYFREFSFDYRGYYFPNEIEYFNYFNNMCLWIILVYTCEKHWIGIFQKYFKNLELIKKNTINFSDKTILLITLIRRLLDCQRKDESKILPRVIFFNELEEIDQCYNEAYIFHLQLIDSITEESKLMMPFLQLNSYIMKMVLTNEDKNFIKKAKKQKINDSSMSEDEKIKLIKKIEENELLVIPAYTISMISVEIIKKHLKGTMKPYSLIFGKDCKEQFSASVYKDNNIICFNEDKIFEEIYIDDLKNLNYRKERNKDFTFILNIYFLHENSSHNKERVINNNQESPIIFLDDNLISSIILSDENCDFGEAGCFTENFIGNRETILGLVNSGNSFGDLLDVKYFNKDSFDELIKIYNSRMKEEKESTKKDEMKNRHFSSFNKELSKGSTIKKDDVKRDAYGFSAYDNMLFAEARRRFCNY